MKLQFYLTRCQPVNGLQLHMAALTPKLAALPMSSPPIRLKLVTVATISTSPFLPLSRGLCSRDDADMMHMLPKCPFDIPNMSRMNMYRKSERIIGRVMGDEFGPCTLHIKKRGTKRVRSDENSKRRLADQSCNRGNEQRYRPRRSPPLNTRKWMETNKRGWMSGFIGDMDVVIGG